MRAQKLQSGIMEDKMKKIGIIGAMEVEVAALKSKMEIAQTVKRASMEFCEGTLAGGPAVVVKSGVGKVNAGMCVQILADLFQVTHVINTGIAGSLRNEINIGDVVISTDALQHDMDATGFGYPLGEIPQLGMREFPANERMAALAQEVCRQVNPDIQALLGRIVTGDQFICSRDAKNRIAENFGGFCTEMEGAAVAQAACLNGIPYVVIRAISDKADDSAHETYEAFEKKAVEHSVKIVMNMLERL